MDKFKAAHEQEKGAWKVAGKIEKKRPKYFVKKLKKILDETLSSGATVASKKQKDALSFDTSSKELQSILDVEVEDTTSRVLSDCKKKKARGSKSDVNSNTLTIKEREKVTDTTPGENLVCSMAKIREERKTDRRRDLIVVPSDGGGDYFHKKKKKKKKKKAKNHRGCGTSRYFDVSPSNVGEPEAEVSVLIPHVERELCHPMYEAESLIFESDESEKKNGAGNVLTEWHDVTIESNGNKDSSDLSLEMSGSPVQHFRSQQTCQDQSAGHVDKMEGKDIHVRKRQRVDEVKPPDDIKNQASLIINTEPDRCCTKLPLLLQNLPSDKEEDDMEAALRKFYRCLQPGELPSEIVYGAEMEHLPEMEDSHENYSEGTIQVHEDEASSNHSNRKEEYFYEREAYSVNGNWEVEENTSSSVLLHQLPHRDQFLLLMKHPNTVFFKGRLCVSVLMGRVEVLGCTMSPQSNSRQTLYSPKGSSMLSIETCFSSPPSSLDYEIMAENFVELGLELSKDIIADVEQRDCVVLLEAPQPSPLEGYLKTMPPFMHLFTFAEIKARKIRERDSSPFYKAEELLQCVFELPEKAGTLKRYQKGPDWDGTASTIIREAECTVVCGGKSVGKSTFLRFLVNRCLAKFETVLYLDFDPGQAEFTVPGCVSAVIIKRPLLGPNFTHITEPECMVFVGDVNISQCPTQYMNSVQHIITSCRSEPHLVIVPWVVNTMGFNKGLGVDLTTSVIRMMRPQHVVQIQSFSAELNFPELLRPAFVHHYKNRFCQVDPDPDSDPDPDPEPLQYILYKINTMAEDKRTSTPWGMSASRLREAMILSYLSQMLKPPKYLLAGAVPYKTPFSKIKLCVCYTKLPFSQILSAINGNLVALCRYIGPKALVPDDPQLPSVLGQQPVCPCLGFGVVRGVDLKEKHLYLSTPIPESSLKRVNCLMLGTIMLPNYVYITASECNGEIPYVATGPGQALSKVAHRFFRPLQHVHGTKMKK